MSRYRSVDRRRANSVTAQLTINILGLATTTLPQGGIRDYSATFSP